MHLSVTSHSSRHGRAELDVLVTSDVRDLADAHLLAHLALGHLGPQGTRHLPSRLSAPAVARAVRADVQEQPLVELQSCT